MNMTLDETRESTETFTHTQQVLVRNELGLHARPAGKLAQEAQKFAAEIFLAVGNQQVDAKSILDILTLAAGRGSELQILARGDDAEQAVEHLATIVRERLGEDR